MEWTLLFIYLYPEKRKFYELEKMWSELIPKEKVIYMIKNFKIYYYYYFIFCLNN